MDSTVIIARLAGPLFLVGAAAIVANRRGYQEMTAGMVRQPSASYLFGMLSLLGGLAIVNFHNVWTASWPVLITILGWLSIVTGTIRMVLPGRMAAFDARMVMQPGWIVGNAVVAALIGTFLTIKGYEMPR